MSPDLGTKSLAVESIRGFTLYLQQQQLYTLRGMGNEPHTCTSPGLCVLMCARAACSLLNITAIYTHSTCHDNGSWESCFFCLRGTEYDDKRWIISQLASLYLNRCNSEGTARVWRHFHKVLMYSNHYSAGPSGEKGNGSLLSRN